MIARMFILFGLSFLVKPSCDYKIIARPSRDSRTTFLTFVRSMVIDVCNYIGEHQASVSRMSHECRANVVQHVCEVEVEFANVLCDNRTTFVRLSQICLNHPLGLPAM